MSVIDLTDIAYPLMGAIRVFSGKKLFHADLQTGVASVIFPPAESPAQTNSLLSLKISSDDLTISSGRVIPAHAALAVVSPESTHPHHEG